MNVLVTGGSGFIGSYLVNHLLNDNHKVFSVSRTDSQNLIKLREGSEYISCDFSDAESIKLALKKIEPDIVFHLASQSNIPESWTNPTKTFRTNIDGTVTLLEQLRNSKTEPKIHFVCSSSEYGSVDKNDIPIDEEVKLSPSSPYAVSKVTMDLLGFSYWKSYGMKITRSRPFAIIGPGKIGDVLSDFSKGIVVIETGKKDSMSVGNLESVRDFLDVRDCVNAISTIVKLGRHGHVYNICSSKGNKIQKILDILKKLSKKKFETKQDPKRMRLSDDPILVGDNTKLKKLEWLPKLTFENTIKDTLNFWRDNGF